MANGKLGKLKQSGKAAEKKSPSSSAGGTETSCPGKAGWIEIELVGEDDKGIPDQGYKIVLPDGTERTGKTDARGLARVEHIEKGTCKVSFPDLDAETWEEAEGAQT